MKKILTTLAILLWVVTAQAVLKEKDFPSTLNVLRYELELTYKEQHSLMQHYEQMSSAQHAQLIESMKRCEQIGLMLYSQKSDFTFDIAYACQEATTLYREFDGRSIPYTEIVNRIKNEIAKYDSLIVLLKELPPAIRTQTAVTAVDSITMNIISMDTGRETQKDAFTLSKSEQQDRSACLKIARGLKVILEQFLISLQEDNHYYEVVSKKVTHLNDYAMGKYKDLQNSIFKNADDNYFTLLSKLPHQLQRVSSDIDSKYKPLGKDKDKHSEWRGFVVLGVSVFMIFYIVIATILSNLLLRWIPYLSKRLFPKFSHHIRNKIAKSKIGWSDDAFKQKQHTLILALGILLFFIVLTIAQNHIERNLFQMAAKLMREFALLIEVILVSLLIRLKPNQTKRGVALYLPFLCMAFIIIVFRIILIPNNLVSLICPPLLLLFTIWQFITLRSSNGRLPMSDMFYSGISLAAIIVACVSSWTGHTLLAVQIIIWWTFQLTAIQTITCLYDLMSMYEDSYLTNRIFRKAKSISSKKMLLRNRHSDLFNIKLKRGDFFSITWFYDFVNIALVPIAAVLSVLLSIVWAADLFEMKSVCQEIFEYNFVDEKDAVQISLFKLCQAFSCYFLFKYLNYAILSLYRLYRKTKAGNGDADFNETLSRNVISIAVWGIYIIFMFITFKVPKSGIGVVTAGLATGMGFAMKDLLENFFYGISLMSGRVRVGDYIECDGIQGKVESISYQSTQIITLDGSVMAFLNSALFNKNFKNLTRNHSYELVTVPVGVAYGSNISEIRQMLIDAIEPLNTVLPDGRNILNPEKEVSVLFSDFGASSVDLKITFWVLVDKKSVFMAKVRETVYQTLNAKGIEIPFPQQDIYIREMAKSN